MLRKLLFTIALILLIIVTFIFPFGHYFMNRDFFHNEFVKTGTYERLGVEKTNRITENLFNFFRGKEPLGYFTEEEVNHMTDVRGLWITGNIIYTILIILLAIVLFLLFALEHNVAAIINRIERLLMLSGGIGGIITSTLFLSVNYAFTGVFDIFHTFFFEDNWWFGQGYLLFDYATQDFFRDAGIGIFFFGMILFIVFLLAGIAIRFVTQRMVKTVTESSRVPAV